MEITEKGRKKYSEARRIIRRARDEKQLVLFVGAGASVDAGMPLWENAVKQIASKLNIEYKEADTVKIPQYYYNSHGKREYTQLMREIFRYQEELEPQLVHDRIIEFNTDTIITTNYDHLIEMAAKRNREFIQVISKDTDLPYRKCGKELIKMHGDFENDNFVLKEDDYLHYTSHFKLIENYIKSIIGVKTILFIGYSLSDPDVKQLFAWVSEVLDKDFQHAYLIKADGEYDEFEDEYFKHLGVNLIYASSLLDSVSSRTESLLGTLSFILDRDSQNQSLVELLYEELKPFEHLNYTYYRYIEKAFNKKEVRKYGIIIDNGYLSYSGKDDDSEGKKFIDDILTLFERDAEPKVDEKVKALFGIFKRSGIKGVRIKGKDTDFPIDDWSEVEKAIYYFDYDKLRLIKNRNTRYLSDKDAEPYLLQARSAAFLYDYTTAYTCLNNAIDILYKRKEYAKYFISLFSKYNIGRIIIGLDSSIEADANFKAKVRMEIEALDLDKTLASIPDLDNNGNAFLKDFLGFKFASELFYSAYKSANKVKDEATKTFVFYAGIPAYQELRNRVFDYYLYCLKNCILVDRFAENNEIFDIYVRSLMASLSTLDKSAEKHSDPFFSSRNIHAKELTEYDIHLILRYGTGTALKSIFDEHNIHILSVSNDGKDYMRVLSQNIPVLLDGYYGSDKGVFDRFLILVSHTKLEEDLVVHLLGCLNGIDKFLIFRRYRDSMYLFLDAVCTQKMYVFGEVCQLTYKLLNKLLSYCVDDNTYSQLLWSVIASLINCCCRGGLPYNDSEAIRRLLEKKQYQFIIDIYGALSIDAQTYIKEYLSSKINDPELTTPVLYADMLINNLRMPDSEIENRCYDSFEKEIDQREGGTRTVYFYFRDPIVLFANLYITDKLIDKERFVHIVSRIGDKSVEWLVGIETFNYDSFDLKWLFRCHDSFLKELSSNKVVSDKILSRFYHEFSKGTLEKEEIDVVLKHFIINKHTETEMESL